MIKTSVSGQQEVKDAIRKAIEEFATEEYVTVGIHEDAGMHEEGEITNATLGAILHFGNDNIPARPWLDTGVASGNKEYLAIIQQTAKKGGSLGDALEMVGLVAVGKVQQFMTELKTPPNAESTIEQKGSSNPLIDTGALRLSVTHKVSKTKPTEGI